MNLLDLFRVALREHPEAVALGGALPDAAVEDRAGPGAGTLTYGALFARAGEAAAGLAARGVAPGDRVAIVADSDWRTVALYLGTLGSGAVAVPVNLAYRPREVAHILGDAEPWLVVADEGARLGVAAALEERGRGRAPELVALGALFAGEPGRAGSRAAEAPDGAAPGAPGAADDPALLVYTSGTTGASKGAVLTHGNLGATVTALASAWAWRKDDVLLLTLPLFHIHGLVVGLFTALASGARVELRRRFRAAEVAGELAGGGASLFFGVPTMYVRLLEEIPRLRPGARFDGVRLFASGSAPLAPETFAAFRAATGHEILERYGMTETGITLSNPYAGERRPGSVGTPLPGVAIRIADPESGAALADGEEGELQVRGASVFAGYWRDEEKTASSFVADEADRRWFRTGDLARREPGSRTVTLLGRRHELILRGGFNVYPREIEEVLVRFPGVREAAVIGRPDPEYGQVPVAFVVAGGEDGPDLETPAALAALTAHCRTHLAAFKVPAEVRPIAELPKNALGKVQKHLLP